MGLGEHLRWMERAIELATENATLGGGPFAALVVHQGRVVGQGVNRTHLSPDPTAHAELLAIQEACRNLGRSDLTDCVLYASGEPCPMCMGAIAWARPQAVYYACSKQEALEAVGFGDPSRPTEPVERLTLDRRLEPFYAWRAHSEERLR